jgi:hypothetical protein
MKLPAQRAKLPGDEISFYTVPLDRAPAGSKLRAASPRIVIEKI